MLINSREMDGSNSAEVDRRACIIVINGVAKYPQADNGFALIADTLMRSFDKANYPGKTVTLSEMGRLKPDPIYCADVINRIHEIFGIPFRVSSGKAAETVTYFARYALARVALTTIAVAGLRSEETQIPSFQDMTQDYGKLQRCLEGNDELRHKVAIRIRYDAYNLRKRSAEQQAWAQTKPRKHS